MMEAAQMPDFLMLGEMLLRLKAPGFERLLTSDKLEANFGGAELNVAVGLSRFGEHTAIVSAIPDNNVGDACIIEMKRWGVDTQFVRQTAHSRLGIYFLEAGSNMRPGKVTYDRAHTAMAKSTTRDFDWDSALSGTQYFHTSGSTVPLSKKSIALVTEALALAQKQGVITSFDFNVRTKLWDQLSLNPANYMEPIVASANILFASTGDCATYLGLKHPSTGASVKDYETITASMFDRFPGLTLMASTFREGKGANNQSQCACMRTSKGFFISRTYEISNIVDRIGTGDAFAAGILYGHKNFADDPQRIVDFGATSSAVKHTVPGDFNLTSVDEINAIMASGGTGSLIR